MIILSFTEVLDELKNLKSNKCRPVAQIATQLLIHVTRRHAPNEMSSRNLGLLGELANLSNP